MFDTASMGEPVRVKALDDDQRRSPEALAYLADKARRIAPLTMAEDRRLEVGETLAELLPEGLQRGTTLGVVGPGSWSLALAAAAGPLRADAWLATVGCEDLCLAAAEELGVPLHRVITVDQPPRASWGAVVAALLDCFELVLVAPAGPVQVGLARKLRHRARERGGVLVDIAASRTRSAWPDAHDLSLRVVEQHWSGLGQGHGVLTARQMTVEASGRRGVRPRRCTLWLPGQPPVDRSVAAWDDVGGDVDAEVGTGVEVEAVPLRQVG